MSTQNAIDGARQLCNEGKLEAAIAKCNKIIPLLSNKNQIADVFNIRGAAKDKMGDSAGALADYNQAITANPQHAKALGNRGLFKIKIGDYAGAVVDFNLSLENDPQNALTLDGRGVAKDNLGHHNAAIADFDEALTIDPQNTKAYNNRGFAKSKMNDYMSAIADYDRALAIDPENPTVIHNRAAALTMLESKKVREEIEAKYQAQLRAQQEQFDRERQKQLQAERDLLQAQQKQFDRERQELLQAQQEQLNREQKEREGGSRIIYSNEYENTMKKYEEQARWRGICVWVLSCVLGGAAVIVYGYIALLGLEEFQTTQSPMAMKVFSPLSLFPFILMGTLVLSPLAWAIRMLTRDKHKYWVLREEAAATLNLLRIIETGHQKREDLWMQLFDHYDKRGSANLIADWNRTDTSGGNSSVSLHDIVSLLSGNKGGSP